MAPYIYAFLDELKSRHNDVSDWSYEDSDRKKLTLPPLNPSVGPLVLHDESEELTLEIGTKYHLHFDGNGTDEYGTDRMHAAAMLAADFVHRVLHDQIGIAVHYNEVGCIGAALIYLDGDGLAPEDFKKSNAGVYGGLIRTERFLWSGPVENLM